MLPKELLTKVNIKSYKKHNWFRVAFEMMLSGQGNSNIKVENECVLVLLVKHVTVIDRKNDNVRHFSKQIAAF